MGSKSKLDPRPILTGHLATLSDESGRLGRRDVAEQYVLPVLGGIVATVLEVKISGTTAAAILTLAGIFAAFFFQLSVQLLDRAADWAESDPMPGPETTRYALLLEELSANTTYAALAATLTAAAALAVGISTSGWLERVSAALTVALLAHLAATLLLVAARVFLLTRARLNAARTGKDRQR